MGFRRLKTNDAIFRNVLFVVSPSAHWLLLFKS